LGGTFNLTNIPARGMFVAMDLTTHKVKWSQQWTASCSAGSLVTGGGVIVHGRNDGRVVALDKDNGNKLWEFQTDAGVNGSATTFMHKGIQHIAIVSAGSLYSTGKHGDSVWMFSLQGTMEEIAGAAPVTASAGLRPLAETVAGAVVEPITGYAANLASGKQIYTTLCAACHGPNGEGGHQGGIPLLDKKLDLGLIMTTASYGRNTMPAFMDVFSKEQLQDVGTYLLQEIMPAAAQ
jgi:alcohol dehydrogenase (cytochrome c)